MMQDEDIKEIKYNLKIMHHLLSAQAKYVMHK